MYFDLVRECYEAFVIYSFYSFLVAYLGGETQLDLIFSRKPQQKHMMPFCFLPSWAMGSQGLNSFLLQTQMGTLQYVIVRPFCAFLTFLFSMTGVYHEGSLNPKYGYFWTALLTNLSQIWAMYCLIMLYMAAKEELKPIKPLPKFMCVKAVVFFTFWQSMFLVLLEAMHVIKASGGYTSEQLTSSIQEFLICIEMAIAAVAHHMAFSTQDFFDPQQANLGEPLFASLIAAFDARDVYLQDVQNLHARVKHEHRRGKRRSRRKQREARGEYRMKRMQDDVNPDDQSSSDGDLPSDDEDFASISASADSTSKLLVQKSPSSEQAVTDV